MKKMKKAKKIMAVLLGSIYGFMALFSVAKVAYAAETASDSKEVMVDADLSEWKDMDTLVSEDNNITEWKLAKSEDGKTLYFCFSGTAVSTWDGSYNYKLIGITYESGTSYNCQICSLTEAWGVPGAEVAMKNNASGTNPGPYAVECSFPIEGDSYTITFAGVTVNAADIPVFVPAEEVEAVYEGIVIDGSYSDWAAVNKVEAACPEEANHTFDCLDYAAAVFDGDYLYLYLQDGQTGSAAGAGLNSNGRYSITSDLGRRIVFQLSTENGGSLKGIDGAQVKYYGKEWEIAIPADKLPIYSESLNFGLYQEEPFVTGVVNLQGNEGGVGEFDGISYDGLFGDWASYPHTLIQYATSGTQNNGPDAEGALHVEDTTLYGHVLSSMDAHLAEQGGEFAKGIAICFNGDREYYGDKTWNLYPSLIAVEDDGTIIWEPQTRNLESGGYEFCIIDSRMGFDQEAITNVSQLQEHEQILGKMWVEVSEYNDEIEFYIDLEQVAKFLSYHSDTTISPDDFKLIEANFGRIGSDYLSYGGTSSGPFLGVGLCIGVVVVVLLRRKRTYKVVEA